MTYWMRFAFVAFVAYVCISTCYWVYACAMTHELLLDITLRQFLTGWWKHLG